MRPCIQATILVVVELRYRALDDFSVVTRYVEAELTVFENLLDLSGGEGRAET